MSLQDFEFDELPKAAAPEGGTDDQVPGIDAAAPSDEPLPRKRRRRKPRAASGLGLANDIGPPIPRFREDLSFTPVWLVWHVPEGHVEVIGAYQSAERVLEILEENPGARVAKAEVE
jgi:hypothetical protein